LSASDPARENHSPGISELKSHSPNVFAAPVAGADGVSHHPAPVFSAGVAKPKLDWPALLDELPHGLVILGPKQELRHENAACRQLTGYGIAEKGGIEGWFSALCPDPGHREKVINSWREHIWRTQLTRTFTLRTADQKPKEIEFRSSLLRDGGITLTLEDVTEARRTGESLRHGKLKFRALFTHTRTGTILVDRTGRIIDANPAFIRLCGIPLKELRLSTLAGLLHPDEAAALAREEEALRQQGTGAESSGVVAREVWLRTRRPATVRPEESPRGEARFRLTYCPVGEAPEPPTMGIYLFESGEAESEAEQVRSRLRALSQKARALLNAVPDLILLIETDGTIADLAPPPKRWAELSADEGWRGRPASEAWPVLGNLLSRCRDQLVADGRTVHAEVRGSGEETYEFSVTLSACGGGQILAVVRNLSDHRAAREREAWQSAAFARAPLPILRLDTHGTILDANAAAAGFPGLGPCAGGGVPFSKESLPAETSADFFALEQDGKSRGSLVFLKPAVLGGAAVGESSASSLDPAPTSRERRQHGFRNQLQLVTSLFSLEPQGVEAREAFLKWQVRLRSLALACPYDDTRTIWIAPLIRDLADEVCSLVGRGPGRREVIVTGEEHLTLDVQTATPFSLLIAELMRLVLATRQPGPGPELHVHLSSHAEGGFSLKVRPGANRRFVFTDRDAEIETLELLTEQIRGRLEPTDAGNPAKEWVLIVPQNLE
jgi:PAS domain S-box-containing protein